jgi:ankyrin repeat protein
MNKRSALLSIVFFLANTNAYFAAEEKLLPDRSLYNHCKTVEDRMAYYSELIRRKKIHNLDVYQHEILLAKNNEFFEEYLMKRKNSEQGIDFQNAEDGLDAMSMLFEAVMYNYDYAIERLLQEGANPYLTSPSGESPLTKSLSSNRPKMKKIFAPCLKDLDVMQPSPIDQESMISKTIRYQNHSSFDTLADKIDPTKINLYNLHQNSLNLFSYAVVFNNVHACTKLLQLGAQYDKATTKQSLVQFAITYNAYAVLHAIMQSEQDDSEASQALRPFYHDIFTQDPITGRTPFMESIASRNVATAVALVPCLKKDLTTTDAQGNTALHYLTKYQLDNYQHCKRVYQRPFNYDIIKIVAPQTHINACNNQDETPIFDAIRQGSVDSVALLIKQGASTKKRNKYGLAPIDIALEQQDAIVLNRKKLAQKCKDLNPQEKNRKMIAFDTKASKASCIVDLLNESK